MEDRKTIIEELYNIKERLEENGIGQYHFTLENEGSKSASFFKLSSGKDAHASDVIEGRDVYQLVESFIKLKVGTPEAEVVADGPQQIRSSFLVAAKKKKIAGAEYPSVTVFVAERNDDGTYNCFKDSFIANDGVIANPEIGSYSGDDCMNVSLEDAPLSKALSWIGSSEKKALASGKFNAEAHADNDELATHYTRVKAPAKISRKR